MVWDGRDVAPGEREVFGQRIAAATGLLSGDDFQLSQMGPPGELNFEARSPAVAMGGLSSPHLVAWSGDTDTGGQVNDEYEVFVVALTLFADGFERGDTSAWSSVVP